MKLYKKLRERDRDEFKYMIWDLQDDGLADSGEVQSLDDFLADEGFELEVLYHSRSRVEGVPHWIYYFGDKNDYECDYIDIYVDPKAPYFFPNKGMIWKLGLAHKSGDNWISGDETAQYFKNTKDLIDFMMTK